MSSYVTDGEMIEMATRAAMQRYHAALEEAVERALRGGEHGVLVTWLPGGISIEVSGAVPYGVIHEVRP